MEDAKAVIAEKAMTADAAVTKKHYMKTAIVILNWNTERYLEQFLPPLLSSVKDIDGAEVIVADNASTDGSMKVMKEKFPEVRTIVFDKNYGFTGGYNRALNQIEADCYVLMNSDVEVSEGWLEPLIAWMAAHPECGACAPKIRSWHKREKFEYAGAAGGHIDRFGYPFCRGRVMGRTEKDNGQYDACRREVFWVSGACMMVRSRLFHKLGGFDERFFAHMEEIDLCWKMQLAGHTVCAVPESVVYHIGGGTLPKNSPQKLFLNYRNNLLMFNNNLARTFAQYYYNLGNSASTAAAMGLDKAEKRMGTRLSLDTLSKYVYMLTFRFKDALAVRKAHKEFASMYVRTDPKSIEEYLLKTGKLGINGVYRKWIISRSILKGSRVFSYIKEKDFIKF